MQVRGTTGLAEVAAAVEAHGVGALWTNLYGEEGRRYKPILVTRCWHTPDELVWGGRREEEGE